MGDTDRVVALFGKVTAIQNEHPIGLTQRLRRGALMPLDERLIGPRTHTDKLLHGLHMTAHQRARASRVARLQRDTGYSVRWLCVQGRASVLPCISVTTGVVRGVETDRRTTDDRLSIRPATPPPGVVQGSVLACAQTVVESR